MLYPPNRLKIGLFTYSLSRFIAIFLITAVNIYSQDVFYGCSKKILQPTISLHLTQHLTNPYKINQVSFTMMKVYTFYLKTGKTKTCWRKKSTKYKELISEILMYDAYCRMNFSYFNSKDKANRGIDLMFSIPRLNCYVIHECKFNREGNKPKFIKTKEKGLQMSEQWVVKSLPLWAKEPYEHSKFKTIKLCNVLNSQGNNTIYFIREGNMPLRKHEEKILKLMIKNFENYTPPTLYRLNLRVKKLLSQKNNS